jgi:AcrR family transcriptional regulator
MQPEFTTPQPTPSRAQEGAKTRENILRQAAELFNTQGYAGASIADIMKATGLKKGGIYNHFTSKEELWLESFEYMHKLVVDYFNEALQQRKHAADRLLSVIDCFEEYGTKPILAGGCPLLNTAIESDSTNPLLRARVRQAFTELSQLIQRIVERGLERGQLRPGTDAPQTARLFLASVEGAIMLSQLFDDPSYLHDASEHLRQHVRLQLAVA